MLDNATKMLMACSSRISRDEDEPKVKNYQKGFGEDGRGGFSYSGLLGFVGVNGGGSFGSNDDLGYIIIDGGDESSSNYGLGLCGEDDDVGYGFCNPKFHLRNLTIVGYGYFFLENLHNVYVMVDIPIFY